MRYIHQVVVRFVLPAFLLAGSVHANVKGTIDTVSGWYPAGSTLTVTAAPAAYRYVEWGGDTNDALIAENEISFTVSGARQVNYDFKDHVTDYMSIPLWWLAEVFTNLTLVSAADFEAAASGTHNGSGLTAGQAYWTGTDPTVEDVARFQIASVTMAGGLPTLSWAHAHVAPGLPPIVIEGRISLSSGVWEYVGEREPTADGTVTWAVTEDKYRFFRLRVQTP